MKRLTVGELKEKLTNVPNDAIIRLSSDTGVDQGEFGEIVVEDAWYHSYGAHGGVFNIYANEEEE